MPEQDGRVVRLRLAVFGTPRCGNSWLRRLIATGYGLDQSGFETAVYSETEIDWESWSDRYIVQVHVTRSPEFGERMKTSGVRILVPVRHPFDVLISILQYATKQSFWSARWLERRGGTEESIVGADPNHPALLDYARSARLNALFEVSRSWADQPNALVVRYEDLVAQTEATLREIESWLGQPPVQPWEQAIGANTLDELRKTHGPGHIWQGKPGLWRDLMTSDTVAALNQALALPLKDYGGPAGTDAAPTAEQARARWNQLFESETAG
jgi:hypothetical protein